MSFLSNLEWRFATKQFDSSKNVEDDVLEKVLRAIRLVPTSFGLQPFHVVVVSDQELKKKMRNHSFLQSQVTDSRYLLVFCARTDIKERINDYIEIASRGDIKNKIKIQPLKMGMSLYAKKMNDNELLEWSRRQAYLALGFALAACAELKIDSCPMEGFSPRAIDKLLELPEHIKSVAYLAVGYRSKDPDREKMRFSEEDLFTKK